MKAVFLVKHGDPRVAFEVRDVPDPVVSDGEALIEVEAFGLNFSEVMARRGLYQDMPPLPTMIGYDVLGRVAKAGDKSIVGKRVVALSTFKSYATLCSVDQRTCTVVPEDMSADRALALSLQYVTAWILVNEVWLTRPEEIALVHAAAGGVGIALTQLLKLRGCKVIAITSSEEKRIFAEKNGADLAILYKKDYALEVRSILAGNNVDAAFNATMGWTFKKDLELISYGGRFIGYGASSLERKRSLISFAYELGLFNLIPFLTNSKSLIFVNVLKLALFKPRFIQRALDGLREQMKLGNLNPIGAGVFPIEDIAKAHSLLESRKAIGKIAVKW